VVGRFPSLVQNSPLGERASIQRTHFLKRRSSVIFLSDQSTTHLDHARYIYPVKNAIASYSYWHNCCFLHFKTWGVVRGIREFVMKPLAMRVLAKVVQEALNEKEES
jgi:hypothetical protein